MAKAIVGFDQYECVQFLNKRIECDNYRGIQISQHNRFDLDIIDTIVSEIYNVTRDGLLQIRTTDLSKRPYNIEGEEQYARLVINIAEKVGRCTQDSLRKNLFVDMHRMGLIERYNSNRENQDPYVRSITKYISLTPLALNFIKTKDIFEKRMIYTRAVDTLMSGYGETIAGIMVDLEMNTISAEEMALFTSFVGQTLDGQIMTISEIEKLLKEFNNMSRFQRSRVIDQLQTYCSTTMHNENKKDKRDWHNWINESQQIICLLGQTAFFERQNRRMLVLRCSEEGVFGDGRLKRSSQEKNNYFAEHNVSKKTGFELHHIVPLCWARSKDQYLVLDNWKNLVYIDAYSHAQISQQRNRYVVLNFEDNNVLLSDYNDSTIKCVCEENIKYKIELQGEMKHYNDEILHSTAMENVKRNNK